MSYSAIKNIRYFGFAFIVLINFFSLLSFAPALYAVTYYVDATNGRDTNNGQSEATAWKTVSKVNATLFAPGDQILFKKGEVWREALNPQSSGTLTNPIIYDAFGTGLIPKLFGSDSKTGPSNWVIENGNVWYAEGINWTPKMVFHNGIGSIRKSNKVSLVENWDWYYDLLTKRIYIYLEENPGNYAIELIRRNAIGFTAGNCITLKNIEIAYADFGIGLWGANNWRIENVFIHDVATTCIQGNNSSKSVTVLNSSLQDWNWNGYKARTGDGEDFMGYGIQVIDGMGGVSDNWVITGNILTIANMESGEDTTAINIDQQGHASLIANNYIAGKNKTGGGIMVWRPKGDSLILIKGNVISNNAQIGLNVSELHVNQFTSGVVIEQNRIFNSCLADVADQEALRIWTANFAPVVVRNNLINNTASGARLHDGIRVRQSSVVVLSNNTIYGVDEGIFIQAGADVSLHNNISAGNRKGSLRVEDTNRFVEDHNILAGAVIGVATSPTTFSTDPQFVNSDTGDFRLRQNSLAIDHGVDMGANQIDLAGSSRPLGNGWDIGSYEMPAGSLIPPPKNLKTLN
jgi:parallel beta-helix repeat protein